MTPANPIHPKPGLVTIVGAGPGDPGLLTIAGRDAIAAADVIVYDRLVNRAILEHAQPSATSIFVGKSSGHHPIPQDEIHAILAKYALQGKQVCRLKGGDPFVFGRGSEETEFLQAQGIPYRVIPGVSSALAVPAWAGIPLTDRRCATSFSVITGHRTKDSEEDRLDWEWISKGPDTLVFLMGLTNLPVIAEQLTKHGRSEDTPVAVIQDGTLPTQKVVTGTLKTIVERAFEGNLHPPALIVVGETVRLKNKT